MDTYLERGEEPAAKKAYMRCGTGKDATFNIVTVTCALAKQLVADHNKQASRSSSGKA